MTTQVDAAASRHRQIADRLEAVGRVEVGDLASRLEVAQETIRRDLKLLEQQGILERVHGGAVRRAQRPLSPYDRFGPRYADGVREIAETVANQLPEQGTVLIGSSAHTSAVAESLSRQERGGLRVVTTSLDVAVILSRVEGMHVYNVGGSLDPQTGAQQGDWALEEIGRFRVDLALLPASGVTAAEGVFVDTPMAAALTAAGVTSAEDVWLITEPEALGRRGFVHAAPLTRVRRIFVSGQPSPHQVEAFADSGIVVSQTISDE